MIDTPVVEEVIQDVVEEVEEPVAEEPVAQTTPAKKTTKPAQKTNNNSGMSASKTNESPTVKEHAESAANKIANTAIDKGEKEATSTIVNSGKKKR